MCQVRSTEVDLQGGFVIPSIFARFLFPRQVASRLYAMGWRKKDMPTKTMFRDLCGALSASGYDIDAAAGLWNRCLRYEHEAIEQLKRDTGIYGVLHLSQFFQPLPEDDKKTASRRRKKAPRLKPE
jgi:hypothetical protein